MGLPKPVGVLAWPGSWATMVSMSFAENWLKLPTPIPTLHQGLAMIPCASSSPRSQVLEAPRSAQADAEETKA